uniref:Cytochrome b-c1 complex subunit 7 n=1 Tax=Acrobeloides nanus TaxID=290746 RepID=A0A914D274_9BILA
MQLAQKRKAGAEASYTALGLRQKQEVSVVGSRPWDKIPNPKNYQYFEVKNAFGRWFRWYYWNHMCGFQKHGLLFHDQYFEPCAEVTEALRRLQMKEPHVYDARIQRLSRGTLKAQENEYLPKEEWTKWEEESWYLSPYLAEVEKEKKERLQTSGLKPGFWLKEEAGVQNH